MNIHFTDIELFEKLKSATLAKVVVGSHMYGTKGAKHLVTDERYCPYRNIVLNKKQIQEKNNKLYNLLKEL